ncbi:MAG: ABC-F family ATP-binding cassette domain-containing protein [Clostridia bacterium]
MLLSAENLFKNYGSKQLLNGVTLHLDQGEKLGLIGLNGVGKSTLLRLLAGVEEPDAGSVTFSPNAQIAYLAQIPKGREDATVLEQVFEHLPPAFREKGEYEAKSMLTQLGITEFDKRIGTLSGGQRKRVALAAAFIHPADVLILDEPTNHLDADMVEWLEARLRKFTGGLIMVTHDRYFLERVITRIVELTRGSTYTYEANYSRYLELRAQMSEMAEASERKRQALMRREYQWLMRGARARSTKSTERIARYEALKEQSAPETDGHVAVATLKSRLGKKTVELENVSKGYDGRMVIAPFSYTVLRDDRIGVVGKNGAGKSTLLNLIAGVLAPDTGSVSVGATVRMGYFTQESLSLNPDERAYDFITSVANSVETDEGTFSASQMLERFLFTPDLQFSPIGRMSGGEKRRLYLLSILMAAPNILLLDEPTNDLDIETLTILEDYLESFPGAVIAVSHDRYFLDKVATQIFEVRDGGEVLIYTGGFEDYSQKRIESAKKPAPKKEAPASPRESAPRTLKFTFKEQREYETIDAEIASIEAAVARCEADIRASASDYVKLQALMAEKQALSTQLDEKTERWCTLNDLAERIAQEKAT